MRKLLKVVWNAFPEIFLNQNNLRDFGNGFFNKQIPANKCMPRDSNKNARKRYKICSKLQ